MGLYISCSSNVKNRKAAPLFCFENGQCFLIRQRRKKELLFDADNQSLHYFEKILSFASDKILTSFEILLTGEELLEDILKFLSGYLLDKDITIGLLTDDINYIHANLNLITYYGLTNPLELASIVEHRLHIRADVFDAPTHGIQHREKAADRLSFVAGPNGPDQAKARKKKELNLDESFHDKFMRHLIESEMNNSDIYRRAGISKQVFSNILSNKDMIPTKNTLVSLCIGLELSFDDAKELIESAGYSLSRSIAFDSIVVKHIRQEDYDLNSINIELYEYGCQLLGWHPRES